MATTCPTGLDVTRLRQEVLATYDRVAREPEGDFHFHRGPDYAAEYLGYNQAELADLPPLSTARFAGVGNPTPGGFDHVSVSTHQLLVLAGHGPAAGLRSIGLEPGLRLGHHLGRSAVCPLRAARGSSSRSSQSRCASPMWPCCCWVSGSPSSSCTGSSWRGLRRWCCSATAPWRASCRSCRGIGPSPSPFPCWR